MPSTSRQGATPQQMNKTPEQRALDIIQQAESNKARIYETPGEINLNSIRGINLNDNDLNKDTAFELKDFELNITKDFVHSAMVDEHYLMVGNHIDENTKSKIVKGEYVDFSKLVDKDRVADEVGPKYHMVFQAGKQFWVPASEGTIITSFGRWEQAFRVYSNIYLKTHPNRASELVQYNHLIHTASQEFVWGNVYQYDKDFRLHMALFPTRNWGIILQQAWTLRLREKLLRHEHNSFAGGDRQHDFSGGFSKDRCCRRFNRGRCTFGVNCKWDHQCKYCGKWGHGTFSCRKLKADKGNGVNNYSVNNYSGGDKSYTSDNVDRKVPTTNPTSGQIDKQNQPK